MAVPEKFLKPYNPNENEREILKLWDESGLANPDVCIEKGVTASDAPPYSIVLPPPNVTGTLHMGHAAMLAIQDILIRYHRMRGDRTLWLPGTDHAAIATQSVVEKDLTKSEKKSRHDLGREEFLKRVEKFAKESHDRIVSQIRAMGASVDWSREAYTLDEKRNLAVRTAFQKMYDAGLIYRGKRIVNWDPAMQTTVSDDEIEYVTQKDPFYYFQYGPFVIGTVRPETKFGDKYVVMHPTDERYKKYQHGEQLELEWINGPIVATVIKDEAADMETGSGVMTITPAHSGIDFEIAQRHNLDIEPVINERGILLPIAGEFEGQHIKKARPLIIEKLKAKGLVVKIDESYEHNVATNSRGGGIIEPQIKEQWFVAVNKKFAMPHSQIPSISSGSETTLKEIMRKAVESGAIKIVPERFERVYHNWIDNLRDWCISRQIWYGHRIPVWYCLSCKQVVVNAEVKSKWFIVRHGETELNVKKVYPLDDNDTLNEKGRAQVGAAAQKLKSQDIGLIISSDYARCAETARIIGKVTGAEVVFDPSLRERQLGDSAGLPFDESKRRFGSWLQSYDNLPGNIETSQALEERLSETFKKHKGVNAHRNVVIVSHGSAIRMLIKNIRRLSFEETKTRPMFGNAEIFSLDIVQSPCSNCGSDLFEQDPDTLDTWFSSGLWTFSTLGWPENRMGFAADIVPQVLNNKRKTYRIRDHELEVGDVVALENSYTKDIFGYGTITDVTKTSIKNIDLNDAAHGTTYETIDDLIAAFERHHPDREITPESTVRIYTYTFSESRPKTDLDLYHPTDILETGYDILFFWVARMILMTGFLLGTIPFRNVYLHGLVRDAQGRKMSKSLGNVLDPLVMTEKYGADAARLSLIIGAAPGNDVKLSEDRVRGYKHFANKLWNISRFVLENAELTRNNAELTQKDKELVAEAREIAKKVSDYIDSFRLDLAADAIYHFVWHRFADEILEESKSILKGSDPIAAESRRYTLYAILDTSLRVLHPFMPFVTEAIWRELPKPASAEGYVEAKKDSELLMVAKWPI
ncbi:hypothetical protein A2118_00590 [Candidatus Kaiserbacteria bacterium GWA2_50_9]|uniref:valine--tRNA ligase n=1 Tax=Candidatus Kaiserbacteria bacterium GWA2_50_9 TaxID=1798474 RepID=A0A1F6BVV6_9BACT|nr:MAG: hypothetical protein A2118_00590 [Candidatus Kaiserbacteria bacterium GWA2_50_9]